ncbi:MAG: response regulator transcription factor [Solirubrobacterales bacterium]|nr:response regulator transcription factor [Solirubrobacterales bacterium]
MPNNDATTPASAPAGPARLRTIIIDDDPLARRTIKDVLQSAGFIVIAEAPTGREGIELVVHYRPDVVLMDVLMPGIDGIEATRLILERVPAARIVLLTSGDQEDVAMMGLRAGAVGFLRKDIDLEVLPRALAGTVDGEAAISRRLALQLIAQLRRTREGSIGMRPVRSPLSGREWEVLDMLCEGSGTEDIADTLVLSTETVRSHVKSILRKLGVSSRSEAIAAAIRLREDEPAPTRRTGPIPIPIPR